MHAVFEGCIYTMLTLYLHFFYRPPFRSGHFIPPNTGQVQRLNRLLPSTKPSCSLLITTHRGANFFASSNAGIARGSLASDQRHTTDPVNASSSSLSLSSSTTDDGDDDDHVTSTSHVRFQVRLQSLTSLLPCSAMRWNRGSGLELSPTMWMSEMGCEKRILHARVSRPEMEK